MSTNKTLIEIVCQSPSDVEIACRYDIDRIELNDSLHDSGLTPSIGNFLASKKRSTVPIICMIRPRTGSSVHTDDEFEVMLEDTKQLLEHGADGIAFGCLTPEFEIDKEKTKIIVDLVHSYNKEAVFHKAFDRVNDQVRSIKELTELKVDRVLTSGGETSTIDGLDSIKKLTEVSDIEILAGGKVRAENVHLILENPKVKQVHSSCSKMMKDPGAHPKVDQALNPNGKKGYFVAVDDSLVKGFVEAVRSFDSKNQ